MHTYSVNAPHEYVVFCAYPLKLTMSLLHAIPKTGNLLLPTNYRRIQMQPMLALLYDRIIASRLTNRQTY